MLIDANNLLQADATVIAGLLILLTIYSFKIARGIPEKEKQVKLACIIISSIIPFASSAVMLLIVDTQYIVAKILAIFGFVYLIISVALIVMIPMRRIDTFTGRAGQDVVP